LKKPTKTWKEYQVIGEKTDKFKKISEELSVPVLTSTQLNRTGENQNKKSGSFNDDSSAIALSDRLQWFASFVGIFRRKTIDEMLLDG
jgi:CRISPR/Cas system-associated protein Csx1